MNVCMFATVLLSPSKSFPCKVSFFFSLSLSEIFIINAGEVTKFVSFIKGPRAITYNKTENVFYASSSSTHSITKITAKGSSSIIAGSGKKGYVDGFGTSACFNHPMGIAVDLQGNLFVSDHYNSMIRMITPQGGVSTLAGSLLNGYADGNGRAAKFNHPWGIWYDEFTNSLLVCDYDNDKIRRVQLNGDVSTLCEVHMPTYITMMPNKIILVSSRSNKIFKVAQIGPKYEVTVLAGSGKAERGDGNPNTSSFNCPLGIAFQQSSSSCFVSEYDGHSVRKISLAIIS